MTDAATPPQSLLPCPFCNGQTVNGFEGDEDGGYGYVECVNQGCGDGHFAGVHADTEAEAITAWNTRAALTRAPAPAEQCQHQFDHIPAFDNQPAVTACTLCGYVLEGGATTAPAEELVCACGKVGKARTSDADIRAIKQSIARYCPSASGSAALAYIEELEALWRYAERQGNIWRGIASAMGYEPNAHDSVKPTSPWLFARIAKYRAALSQIPDIGELREALRRLSFAAQTSGGVAGRDDELVAAVDQAERVLAKLETQKGGE